ncbi:Uncharacterized membrane protein YoaK, UPF0700 family [Granulicella pectinivorans]|uniref:Uncharacterized membrane protein YoaK, UPF0700 family n=1 Tax=Granulicella pectinivorans TaxID=474950 RepID=A0A1I6LPA4_9BACT|nr:Uncharacterized membrane protein YoaK, UPF0700 family [Granulicella pectinivorans]
MPLFYLRDLTGKQRSQTANRHLACFLAFVAGAVNAGGYLAVRQYTSHMSGIVSSMADNLALGQVRPMLAGAGALACFMLGAASTAILVNWARRRNLESEYALPLCVQACLLVCFALMGGRLQQHAWLAVSATVALLCYTMGLQNAMITKISHAEMRTTHVTGMVTDIGIELGKMVYWGTSAQGVPVRADMAKLTLLGTLVGLFFVGGVVGAVAFKHEGFLSALPLAGLLLVLAVMPVLEDFGFHLRVARR